jgi:hypothetical protein
MIWAFNYFMDFVKHRGAGRHHPIGLIIDELASLFSKISKLPGCSSPTRKIRSISSHSPHGREIIFAPKGAISRAAKNRDAKNGREF